MDIQRRIEMLKKSGSADVMSIVRPRAQRRASVGGKWSLEEDNNLKEIVELHGAKSWKNVCSLQMHHTML